jgi:hypothetical protein
VSDFQQAKVWLSNTLHLSKDALHIYVALIVFFGTCLLFRWKASQWRPWLCVLVAALAGEAWDISDSIHYVEPIGYWASAKDLANTMAVPTLLVVLARWTAVFRPSTANGRLPPENPPD